jgi:hypothetical protein
MNQKTIVVVAEGLVWERGLLYSPGPILPGAKEFMDGLLGEKVEVSKGRVERANRVVIVSPVLNTLNGHRNALSALYSADVPFTDVWTSPGFPDFDEVVYRGPDH